MGRPVTRTTYRPDPGSAWPRVIHHQEIVHRPQDCQLCGSPRVITASGVRLCASCGYPQRPSELCLGCGCGLHADSRRSGCAVRAGGGRILRARQRKRGSDGRLRCRR